MSGYRKRAPFYRSEFTVRDDFPLLTKLLTGDDGLVIDIPSGAGRLLPLHQAHRRDVIMVDIEPAMTGQCLQGAADYGIAGRVTAVRGDITTWQPPQPAARVIIARGGLQMLPSRQAITQALTISAANLAPGGLLYLDVATPWTAAPDTGRHLAPFLRFAGTTHLEGSNLIDSGAQAIQRSYTSTLLPDRVTVRFRYQAASIPAGNWEDFETEATWLRIDADTILATLRDINLNLTGLLGDYDDAPYRSRSARCICIATAQ
jgi:Methyltransferase domain